MITKLKPIRGVLNVMEKATYLDDANHPNHRDVTKITSRFYGLGSITKQDLLPMAFQRLAESVHSSKGMGRPREITAWDFSFSPAHGTHLGEDEKMRFESEMLAELDCIGAKTSWHDKPGGTSDLHILALNCRSDGKAIKSADDSATRRRVIAIGTRIERELNDIRKAKGIPLLTTVPEARRRIALDRGLEPLLCLMIRKAGEEGLRDWKQIQSRTAIWIKEAGHRVTRKNDAIISVQYSGSKRHFRYHWEKLQKEVEPGLKQPEKHFPVVASKIEQFSSKSNPPKTSESDTYATAFLAAKMGAEIFNFLFPKAHIDSSAPPALDISAMRDTLKSMQGGSSGGVSGLASLIKYWQSIGLSSYEIERRVKALKRDPFREAILAEIERTIEEQKIKLAAWRDRQLQEIKEKATRKSALSSGYEMYQQMSRERGKENAARREQMLARLAASPKNPLGLFIREAAGFLAKHRTKMDGRKSNKNEDRER